MTPAILTARKHNLDFFVHDYEHDLSAESFGMEASEKLGVDPKQVFKTLVVADSDGKLYVAILPVSHSLSLKKCAKAMGVKKVSMADPKQVEASTGYVLGGVSPLGQKKRLPTVIDSTAKGFATIYVSAGKRGLEIELSSQDLANILDAKFANILS